MQAFKKILKFFFEFFLVLILAFIIAELGFRSYLFFYTKTIPNFFSTFKSSTLPDQTLNYRLRPGFNSGAGESINELGYRGKSFAKIKPEGVIRIVALGGSTTYGVGVRDEETFPARLQEFLSKVFPKIEVINAGVTGYHSYHELLRMPEILSLNPDLIILYSGWNDFGVALVEGKEYKPNTTQGSGVLFNPGLRPRWQQCLLELSGYSAVLHYLKNYYTHWAWTQAENERGPVKGDQYSHSAAPLAASDASKPSGVSASPTAASNAKQIEKSEGTWEPPYTEIANNYQSNLEKIIKEANTAKVPVVLATLPFILRQTSLAADDEAMHHLEPGLSHNYWFPYSIWQKRMSERQHDVAKKNQLMIIETAASFDMLPMEIRQLLFNDMIHLSATGNGLLAERMAQDLIPYLKALKKE